MHISKIGKKGEFGYIRRQRLIRTARSLAMFGLVIAILAVGLVLNQGDKKNIYTAIAIVGCIPASMSAVSAIMVWLKRPMKREIFDRIQPHMRDLAASYEIYVTVKESSMLLDAAAIRGDYCMAYTAEKAGTAELGRIEAYMRRFFQGEGYPMTVKIYTREAAYLDRLDQLAARPSADPDRDGACRQVLRAMSL